MHGLVFSEDISELFRRQTLVDRKILGQGSVLRGVMVFINPEVAKLPQHAHLFGGEFIFSLRNSR